VRADLRALTKGRHNMTSFRRPIVNNSFALLLAAMVSFPAYAAQQSRGAADFDGPWSLVVETTRGSCPAAVRAGVQILGGQVLAEGPSYRIDGRVTRNGAVRVTVFAAGQSGGAYGRLSSQVGRGLWRTSSGDCSGTWVAERRGQV
jgi:hypothetical protein